MYLVYKSGPESVFRERVWSNVFFSFVIFFVLNTEGEFFFLHQCRYFRKGFGVIIVKKVE